MRQQEGFGLLQWLLVTSLLSISLLYSVSIGHGWYQKYQLNNISKQLYAALSFTKTESLIRQVSVCICPSDANNVCVQNWSSATAWLILPCAATPENKVIFARMLLPNHVLITWNRAYSHICFASNGYLCSQPGTFSLSQKNVTRTNTITINLAGRIRLEI